MVAAFIVLLALVACMSAPAAPQALSPGRIAEILASPDRSQADRSNDLRRKPAEMLAFIGVRPGMVALDLSAGGGYTSELLARSVAPAGRVYAQITPRPAPPAGLAARAQNPHAGSIAIVMLPFTSPSRPSLARTAWTWRP